MIKHGKLRADKILYEDGVGCTVWYPFGEECEEMGLCFDFALEDIADFIELLEKVKFAAPEVYDYSNEDDNSSSFFEKHLKRIHIGADFHPFNWKLRFNDFMFALGPFTLYY